VELNQILDRFVEGISAVDSNTKHTSANRRTGEMYLPGVKTMNEPKFVEEFLEWWRKEHADDFSPRGASDREVKYPGIPRAKCDLIFSSEGSPLSTPEWSIEVKHVALVGNNGKNNDFGVAKILSPYLKDRSLIHDIERLRDHGIGKRKAVVGYSFEYSYESCYEAALKHPSHLDVVENIREVCRMNDPENGAYPLMPMIEFANEIFQHKGLVKDLKVKDFKNAWRHPAGGNGKFFAWELVH
jgi:hypothetical protein